MDITARQEELIGILETSEEPKSGQALAQLLNVTRQVIVHDIAVLRAASYPILSTPKGYIWQQQGGKRRALIAVSHAPEQTRLELTTLVDCGVRVVDVRVEHQIYGEITASLYIASRRDVEQFLDKVSSHHAPLLSSLTEGAHYHLVEYETKEQLAEAIAKLREAGIVVHE